MIVDVSVRADVGAGGGEGANGRTGAVARRGDGARAGARVARGSDNRLPLPARIMSCSRALRRSRRSASDSTTGAGAGALTTGAAPRAVAEGGRVETDSALVATPTANRAQARPPIAKADSKLLKASPD